MTRLAAALRELMEAVPEPPEANCSCHVAPPCGDCTTHYALRSALAEAREALLQCEVVEASSAPDIMDAVRAVSRGD